MEQDDDEEQLLLALEEDVGLFAGDFSAQEMDFIEGRYSPLSSSDGDSRSSRGQGSEESSTSRSRGDLKRFSDGERKVARLTRPRIPKSDFRRNYANMWVNVFNSCDRELMLQHLQQFYHPDVLVRQRDVREDHTVNPQRIPHFQTIAQGTPYLAQLWYAGMTAAPDLVCSLRHTFVKVRADGSAVIKCCFALKGTQVSDLDHNSQANLDKIARYQAYRAAGRRDITITEAAVAAVAPTSMLMPRTSTGGGHHTSSSSSLRSQASSNKDKDATSNTDDGAQGGSMEVGGGVGPAPSSAAATPVVQQSGEKAEVAVKLEPLSNLPHDSSTRSIQGMGHKLAPLQTNRPDIPSTSAQSVSSAGSRNNSKPSTPHSTASSSNSNSGINWLALADYAYNAGTLEPCKPKGQKTYYYSENSSVSASLVPSPAGSPRSVGSAGGIQGSTAGSGSDGYRGGGRDSGGSGSNDGTETEQSGAAQASESVQLDGAIDNELSALMRRTVITASIDCICGIEMEMNPDGHITSVVLHYFR